ncbi:SGNH/GDSL hydrolase family protein [Sinomonas sp. JGH33]|uniref:SGNH/GDSL hydrolase family protein n=1 Tax=Sinomonas terricola TaxID=3110330 RepID=A0ABU5T228_9MICC|nr:SGNH/GDSL hydrolase family protein [Sinomonas sp. JGH33]MEA5453709.1 SGNH/GDSL hydrolase family protein [Sinomonas sp. JGH33]
MTRIAHKATRFTRAVLSLLAALGLMAGTAALPASAAPSTRYVALGDSIAAGTGGGAFLNACLQTASSYPALLGASANEACFGATTADVVATQVPGLPPTVRSVTITVGANDVGDVQVAVACTTDPTSLACQQALYDAVFVLLPQLPAKVTATIAAVRSRAPGAQITLTGYPLLFTVSGLPASEQPIAAEINTATALLNSTIGGTALVNSVHFADVTSKFLGHGLGSSDPWINPFTPGDPGSFHPTATGYGEGYVPVVAPLLH